MAAVRLTNDLRRTILSNAMEAFSNARPQPKPDTELTTMTREAVLRSPPYLHLQSEFNKPPHKKYASFGGPPENKIQKEDTSTITIATDSGFIGAHAHRVQKFVVEFVPSITTYRRTDLWNGSSSEVKFEELLYEDRSRLTDKYVAFMEELSNWAAEKEAYHGKIEQLLERCSSIKQLITAWPGGESLIPNEAKQRMYTVVSRKETVKKIKEDIQFED
jgi:hypothetical protein